MLVQVFPDLGRSKSAVDLVVDDRHRRQRTGAKACHAFDAELVVIGSVAGLNAQLSFYGFESLLPAANVAGRAQADLYGVFCGRGKPELGIKRGYPKDLALRNSEELGYLSDGFM